MTPPAVKQDNANLDILRAIAVLAVLLYHCFERCCGIDLFNMGRFGVLVFFVHTALVLMMSLERLGGDRMVTRFYTQRFFRIYPLSSVCVLACVALRIPPNVHAAPLGKLVANLLLIQNIYWIIPQTSFAEASVSGPLWSLPFEVQMYLALPLLFWILRRWPRATSMVGLVIISIAMAAAERAVLRVNSGTTGLAQFAPCFMGGVVSYWLRRRVPARIPWQWWPPAVILTGIIYHIVPLKTPLSWLLCLTLGAMIPLFRQVPNGRLALVSHLIARYSYGIYLAHLPLLWLCLQRLPTGSVALKWSVFALSICLLPVVLYHGIESPMIRFGKRGSFLWRPDGESG